MVIQEINSDLLSNLSQVNQVGIKLLFLLNLRWISYQSLFENINKYAAMNAFSLSSNSSGNIFCKRAGDNRRNKMRSFMNGSLGCNCDFHVQLQSTIFKSLKADAKVKRK